MVLNFFGWIHKKEPHKEKIRVQNIEAEIKVLKEKNSILENKIEKLNQMFKEISEQTLKGKLLLGTHRIQTGRDIFDPDSKEYDTPELLNIYYMYEEKEDSESFYIRAHYAGEIHEFKSERNGIEIPNPENQAYIFLIEGRFPENRIEEPKKMYLDQLNTKFEYRKLGIATIGLDYLKDIAIYNKVKTIYGEMGDNHIERQLPKFYKNRGFEVYGKNNDRFKLKLC
ncbi:MAG: hypothetical protein K2Q22_13145 [Cytophagales bacterium]|nr:hypothetical protein [Cytophagales bacterium]